MRVFHNLLNLYAHFRMLPRFHCKNTIATHMHTYMCTFLHMCFCFFKTELEVELHFVNIQKHTNFPFKKTKLV